MGKRRRGLGGRLGGCFPRIPAHHWVMGGRKKGTQPVQGGVPEKEGGSLKSVSPKKDYGGKLMDLQL